MSYVAFERAPWRRRGFPVRWWFAPLLCFSVAFVVDLVTGRQYSTFLGSTAIIASLLGMFPAVRIPAIALGAYGACWLGFNLSRAVADDAPWSLADPEVIARFETRLAGGRLPSSLVQAWLPDGLVGGTVTRVAAIVHLSFFIVPFVMAVLLWRASGRRFATYAWATGVGFALSLAGFVLLPTAPPWLAGTEGTTRLMGDVLPVAAFEGDAATSVPVEGLRFEPNHLAALPSVHVMAAVLVAQAARPGRGHWSRLALAYPVAMSIAVVLLGEHYVLDVLLGWGVAILAWAIASSQTRARASAGRVWTIARPVDLPPSRRSVPGLSHTSLEP